VKLPVTSGEMFFAVPAGKPVEAAWQALRRVPATAAQAASAFSGAANDDRGVQALRFWPG
jgi:hypothetical protein